MNELRERFRTLDTLEVPDVLARARSIGPRSPDPEPTPRGRRIGAYVLAAAIATLALIAIARALDQPERPADEPSPAPRSLGSLAYAVDGDIYVADWDGSNPVRIGEGSSRQRRRRLPSGRIFHRGIDLVARRAVSRLLAQQL